MGESSSPPFLYDPVSQWSFNDYHRGKAFNPKTVTQASRAPRPQRPTQDGPLVNFNTHPDAWVVSRQTKPIIPMSRHTKTRVTYTRGFQLLLRTISILGAIGILFCVICVTNTDVALGWIIRVAPSVAILHTIYAIYHLARSAASRPAGSSASYHLFASCMDAGLIPFYAFTSFVTFKELQNNYYNWGTLFNDAKIQNYIFNGLYIAGIACSGLHFASLVISIYLATVFRQIMNLPPDMNPLEDNLTARPSRRSKRKNSELKEEKHMSSSTLDSAYFSVQSHLDDTTDGIPRTVPFMHTRQQSANSLTDPKRASQTSIPSNRQPRAENESSGQRRVYDGDNRIMPPSTRTPAHKTQSSSRPNSVIEDAPVLLPTSTNYVPTTLRWSNPTSNGTSTNWLTYDSPADEDEIIRSSKPPSRSKNGTPFPGLNGAVDWLGPVPRFGRVESGVSHKEARGQYASLETSDTYENDEVTINKENLEEDITNYLNKGVDPLRMNPPTPQPKEESSNNTVENRVSSLQRAVLGVLTNGTRSISGSSYNKKKNDDDNDENDITNISALNETDLASTPEPRLKTFGSMRLWSNKSNKPTYASIHEDEPGSSDNESDDEDESNPPPALSTPKRRNAQATLNDKETDQKGRVVSNSGIDLGTAFQTGMNSKQYSEYISGLGVGRRRDVSGKIAEEGRGGVVETADLDATSVPNTPEKIQRPIRAAGWARFAGL